MIGVAQSQAARTLDIVGVAVSSLCVLHCWSLPLLFIFLPTLHAVWGEQEWVHWLFVFIAGPIAYLSLTRGLLRHKRRGPLWLAASGFVVLVSALFLHDPHWLETALTSLGAGLMITAHSWNFRLTGKERFRHANP